MQLNSFEKIKKIPPNQYTFSYFQNKNYLGKMSDLAQSTIRTERSYSEQQRPKPLPIQPFWSKYKVPKMLFPPTPKLPGCPTLSISSQSLVTQQPFDEKKLPFIIHSNLDIVNKSVRPYFFTYQIISKSSKWELSFVYYIAKFTILRFITSRFECTYITQT